MYKQYSWAILAVVAACIGWAIELDLYTAASTSDRNIKQPGTLQCRPRFDRKISRCQVCGGLAYIKAWAHQPECDWDLLGSLRAPRERSSRRWKGQSVASVRLGMDGVDRWRARVRRLSLCPTRCSCVGFRLTVLSASVADPGNFFWQHLLCIFWFCQSKH